MDDATTQLAGEGFEDVNPWHEVRAGLSEAYRTTYDHELLRWLRDHGPLLDAAMSDTTRESLRRLKAEGLVKGPSEHWSERRQRAGSWRTTKRGEATLDGLEVRRALLAMEDE